MKCVGIILAIACAVGALAAQERANEGACDEARNCLSKVLIYICIRGFGAQAIKLAHDRRPFSPRFRQTLEAFDSGRQTWKARWRSLSEMPNDGSNLHELLPGWNISQRQCCGIWTADGRYYIFQASQSSPTTVTSLRALRRNTERHRGENYGIDPVTEAPMSFEKHCLLRTRTRSGARVQPVARRDDVQLCHRRFEAAPRISATGFDFRPTAGG